MKAFYLNSIILIFFIMPLSRAQIVVTDEDKDLTFQNYFFEALKQKAIQNYSKAIENLEKCHEIDSTQMVVDFELSKNFLHMKKYFEAEQFINSALQKDANNIYFQLHKVNIYKDIGNYKQAIELQKILVNEHPKYNQDLVELYVLNKDYKKAEALIEKMNSLAISTRKTSVYKQFLEDRKRTLDPKKPDAKVADQDLESMRKTFESNKDFSLLKNILALEEVENLFELMAIDSQEGIELYPAQPILYLMHAKAQNSLGKYNEAIRVLGIGIDFVIDDISMEIAFYTEMVNSYDKLNDTTSALKYKQKAEQLRQKDK